MLNELSHALADIVEAVRPSLLAHRGRRFRSTLFAIDPHHAVGSARALRRLGSVEHDGHRVDAEVVGRARGLDLAVVRVGTELPPVRWGEVPRVGSLVVPVAVGPRATLGMLSEVGGPWFTPMRRRVDQWIEVDGTLPPGFSGGPLLASDGRVVGMNTRRLVRGGTTLPAATVRDTVATLLARGTVEPGYLGIGAATATLTEAQAEAAGQPEALLVVAVEPDSPAQGVLTVGDIVLAVAGEAVAGVPSLRRVLDAHGPEREVALRVLTADGPVERPVTLGARPKGC